MPNLLKLQKNTAFCSYKSGSGTDIHIVRQQWPDVLLRVNSGSGLALDKMGRGYPSSTTSDSLTGGEILLLIFARTVSGT